MTNMIGMVIQLAITPIGTAFKQEFIFTDLLSRSRTYGLTVLCIP